MPRRLNLDDTATHLDANAPKYSVARLYPQERHDALDNFLGAAGTLAGRLYWISRGWRVHPHSADHRAGGPGHSVDWRATSNIAPLVANKRLTDAEDLFRLGR